MAKTVVVAGAIKSLKTAEGFGFVTDQPGRDYFFHRSDVDVPFETLAMNEPVEFAPMAHPKGPRATVVRVQRAAPTSVKRVRTARGRFTTKDMDPEAELKRLTFNRGVLYAKVRAEQARVTEEQERVNALIDGVNDLMTETDAQVAELEAKMKRCAALIDARAAVAKRKQ